MKKVLLFLFLLNISGSVKPVITGAETFINKDKNQYVTCIHTIHMDYPDKAITQQEQASLIKHARALDAAIAVEDSLSYEGSNKEAQRCIEERTAGKIGALHFSKLNIKNTQKGLQQAAIADPAMRLMDLCKKEKIPCYNVDAGRIVQMAAVWEDTAKKQFAISGKEVWNSIKEEINTLLSYDADDAFMLYPITIAKFLSDNENYLSIMRTQEDLRKLYFQNPDIWNFLCFDLVDLRILHSLSLFKERKHLVIIAGEHHHEALSPIFKKELGYTQILSQINKINSPNQTDREFEALDLESYFKMLDEISQKEAHNKK